jgi:hypothetical protein
MKEFTNEEADRIMAADDARRKAFLDKWLSFEEWMDLLHRCQDGFASCMYVAKKIEHDLSKDIVAGRTPNAGLPPLDPARPKRKMVITIEVADNFENRLDNQWMIEREIHADRYTWQWKT